MAVNAEARVGTYTRKMALHSLNHPSEGHLFSQRALKREKEKTKPPQVVFQTRDKDYSYALGFGGMAAVASVGTLVYALALPRPSHTVIAAGLVATAVEVTAA